MSFMNFKTLFNKTKQKSVKYTNQGSKIEKMCHYGVKYVGNKDLFENAFPNMDNINVSLYGIFIVLF